MAADRAEQHAESAGLYAGLYDLARDVAAEAGQLVQRMRREGVEVAGTKSSDVDVVTRADQASEELIRRRLLAERPDDGLLGEEGDEVAGTSGVRWVVDPIDGTVNYLYGLPAYAVSVAAEHDGEVVAGVVLNPATGEEYGAVRGAGAWLRTPAGRTPLRVREPVETARMLVATGFNYELELRRDQGRAVARLLTQVRDVRRMGACSLDLCAVASGRVDAYLEEGVHAWDHAAGGLVAAEAGATVRQGTGAHGRLLLTCAAPAVIEELVRLAADCGF